MYCFCIGDQTKTLQNTRGRFNAVANIFVLGMLLIGFSGRANGNIYFEANRSHNPNAHVLHTTLALKISNYFIPELLTPKAPGETLWACVQGWSRHAQSAGPDSARSAGAPTHERLRGFADEPISQRLRSCSRFYPPHDIPNIIGNKQRTRLIDR